jgi:hypothetical protein
LTEATQTDVVTIRPGRMPFPRGTRPVTELDSLYLSVLHHGLVTVRNAAM